MFRLFISEENLDKKKVSRIERYQKSMELVSKSKKPIILITYAPYISKIKQNGFTVIASTRTLTTFHVVESCQ